MKIISFSSIVICTIFSVLTFGAGKNPGSENKHISTGAERLLTEYRYLLKGKKVGIITNHTAVLQDGSHFVDVLNKDKECSILALFGPEHGIRGDAPAGEKIENGIDKATGITTYSLYGKNNKPTKEMLRNIDLLIFDIQDVGSRFYTYISTLYYTIEAAAENNIPLIVLDRPAITNGAAFDGPIRKDELKSFVGIAAIPVMYGMTMGELAKMFAGVEFIGKKLKTDLTVIELKNWKRNSYFDEYDNKWVSPSPNIPNLNSAIAYAGTCLIEGTNVSEGRGTDSPFLEIGAPFINSKTLIDELKKIGIPGLELKAVSFTPIDIEGKAANPKFKGQKCNGIFITITDRAKFEPVKFGVKLVYALNKLYPKQFEFKDNWFDKLIGDKIIRNKIKQGVEIKSIVSSWEKELQEFNKIRLKYIIYK
ncbi:MAG: DUF1343 domain-containing protein [Bacteroidota bacterium]|nr:DUF1343 domain-containing protein [Bacteroidota bacterium]